MQSDRDQSLRCGEEFSELDVEIEQSNNIFDELQYQVCVKNRLKLSPIFLLNV